jgi:hypothetical protein
MQTKADKNGQSKTQTVHVALPLEVLRRIRALAHWDKRSLSAQAAWLIERGLRTVEKGQ